MIEPQPPSVSRKESILQRAVDWVFGYDFFLSYSHGDGQSYPRELKERLEQAGFRIFLDQTEYVAGMDLRRETKRQVTKSRRIVVIGRERALKSEWVKREVDVALACNKTPVIIDINGAVEAAGNDSQIAKLAREQNWLRLIENIPETDGVPSDHAVTELVRGFNFTRQESKRARVFVTATFALSILAIGLAAAIYYAFVQTNRARMQTQVAIANSIVRTASELVPRDPEAAALLLLEMGDSREPRGAVGVANRIASQRFARSTLRGHTSKITDVTIAPGSGFIASASQEGRVRIWDVNGTDQVTVLKGHRIAYNNNGSQIVTASNDGTISRWHVNPLMGPEVVGKFGVSVTDLSYDWNGRLMAAAAKDGTVRIWDTASKSEPIFEKRVHNGAISVLAFSPHNNKILTASPEDDTLQLFSVDGSDPEERSVADVQYVEFSPDGRFLLTISAQPEKPGTVRIWDAKSLSVVRTLKHSPPTQACPSDGGALHASFSPDSQLVVTALANCTLEIWTLNSQSEPKVIKGHGGWVRYAVFAPDGKRIVSASDDHTVRVWQRDGTEVVALQGHRNWVTHIEVMNDDGSVFTSASRDRTLRVWDLNQATEPTELARHENEVWSLAIDSAGSRLFTNDYTKYLDGTVRISDLHGTHERLYYSAGYKGDISNQGQFVTVSHGGSIRLWNIENPANFKTLGQLDSKVSTVRFSRDGSKVVIALHDKTARIWTTEGREGATFPHAKIVRSAEFSHDDKFVVTSCNDGVVRIWKSDENGKLIKELPGRDVGAINATFSPDGKFLATSGFDPTVHVWKLDSQEKPQELSGHRDSVWGLAFSPDGKHLASVSDDFSIQVWKLSNADQWEHSFTINRASPHPLTRVTFTPDGQSIIVADRGGGVRIWQIRWGGLIEHMKSRTNACLSIEDRKRHLLESVHIAKSKHFECEHESGRYDRLAP